MGNWRGLNMVGMEMEGRCMWEVFDILFDMNGKDVGIC